jgi:hypothetical protein
MKRSVKGLEVKARWELLAAELLSSAMETALNYYLIAACFVCAELRGNRVMAED